MPNKKQLKKRIKNTRKRNTRRRNTRRKNTRRKNTRRKNTRRRNTRKKNTRRRTRKIRKHNIIGGSTGISDLAKHLLIKEYDEFGWKLIDNSGTLIRINYNVNLGIELNDEMNRELLRIQNILADDLNEGEKDALQAYTGHNYQDINNHLRDPEQRGENEYITQIDNAFSKAPSTEKDFVVFRGTNYDDDEFIQRNATSNNEIYDKAYMSTTINILTTRTFFNSGRSMDEYRNRDRDNFMCCFMMINIPEGSKVLPLKFLSHYGYEEEVLLPSHSKFKFVKEHKLWNELRQVSAKLYEYNYIESDKDNIEDAIEVQIQPNIVVEPSAPLPQDVLGTGHHYGVIARPIPQNTLPLRLGWNDMKFISRPIDQITKARHPLQNTVGNENDPVLPELAERDKKSGPFEESRLYNNWVKSADPSIISISTEEPINDLNLVSSSPPEVNGSLIPQQSDVYSGLKTQPSAVYRTPTAQQSDVYSSRSPLNYLFDSDRRNAWS
tara:strand:- start:5114 stop:6598 length:1485 start_codon:yes stop_codon:yes gene_type:complete